MKHTLPNPPLQQLMAAVQNQRGLLVLDVNARPHHSGDFCLDFALGYSHAASIALLSKLCSTPYDLHSSDWLLRVAQSPPNGYLTGTCSLRGKRTGIGDG